MVSCQVVFEIVDAKFEIKCQQGMRQWLEGSMMSLWLLLAGYSLSRPETNNK